MEFRQPTLKSQLPLKVGRTNVKAIVASCPECLTPYRQSEMRGIVLSDEKEGLISAKGCCSACGHIARIELACDDSGRVKCTVDGELAFFSYGSGWSGKWRAAKAFLTLLYLKVFHGATTKFPLRRATPGTNAGRVRVNALSDIVVGEMKGVKIAEWIEPSSGGRLYFDRTSINFKQALVDRKPDEMVLYPGLIYRPRTS